MNRHIRLFLLLLVTLGLQVSVSKSYAQSLDTTIYLEVKAFVAINFGDTVRTEPEVQEHIDALNEIFARDTATGIQFVLCGEIEYVDHPYVASGAGFAPYGEYEKPGAINIFFTWTITSTADPARGRIVLPSNVLFTVNSVAHEMGHVLSLAHTHEGGGSELVDGSNCATAGDQVCDTPADPGGGFTGCTYTGTAVDANGDPYNPLTNNMMSYMASSCRTSFTPGQGDKMREYLNSDGFFLNRATNPRIIQSIETVFCDSDTAGYVLTPVTAGATVSGPGVVGNTFYANLAGPGIHEVLCTYPSDSVVFSDFSAPGVAGTDTLTDVWNYHRVANSGLLDSVSFKMNVSSSTDMLLEVHDGSSTGGTVIYSQVFSGVSSSGLEWVHFPITGGPALTAGQIYTFHISSLGGPVVFAHDLYTWGSGFNSSSTAPTSGSWRSMYTSVIKLRGIEPCGSASYRYLEVLETDHGQIELLDEYCNIAQNLTLIGTPTNGTFYVDGVLDSLLRTEDLSIGTHIIEFVSTDNNGCAGRLVDTVTIVDQTVLITSPIDSVYCNDSPNTVLTGSPVGGIMTIDGVGSSVIDVSTLSYGIHEVSYLYSQPFDTIVSLDIENTVLTGYYPFPPDMLMDSVFWQTFKPSSSGLLLDIQQRVDGWSNQTFVSQVYKGLPSSGVLLKTDTITYGVVPDYDYFSVFTSPSGVMVEQDSIYSFSLKRIAGSGGASLMITKNNAYSDGVSSLDTSGIEEYDFYFKVYMGELISCTDTAVVSFEMQNCLLGTDQLPGFGNVAVYPNPTNGLLTVDLATSQNVKVRVTDVMGRLIHESAQTGQFLNLDITKEERGVYFVTVANESHRITLRVIKK